MIKEVLQIILTGGMHNKREIARKMGIQNETLDDILKLLVTKGYLRTDDCESVSSPSCSSCPIAESGCGKDNFGQTYYLTDNGKKYAMR